MKRFTQLSRLAAILLAVCWITVCAIQAAGTLHTDPLWMIGLGAIGAAVGTYGLSVSIGGISVQSTVQRSAEHPNPYIFTLPATAKAGTLSTRTDDDTGDITLTAGHGLTSGTYDVYWTGGVQYGCTGTVVSNTLSIASGSGDVLPAEDSAVIVCKQVVLNVNISGSDVKLAVVSMEYTTPTLTTAGHIHFQNDTPEDVAELDLVGNTPRVWDVSGGATNVFTDADPIIIAYASHANLTEAATLKIATLEDRSA